MFSYTEYFMDGIKKFLSERKKKSHYEYVQEELLGPALQALTEVEPEQVLHSATELTSVLPIDEIIDIFDPRLLAGFKVNVEAHMIRLGNDGLLDYNPTAVRTYDGLQILLNVADTVAELRNYNNTADGSQLSLKLMNESSKLLQQNPGLFGETGVKQFNAFNRHLNMSFGRPGHKMSFPRLEETSS